MSDLLRESITPLCAVSRRQCAIAGRRGVGGRVIGEDVEARLQRLFEQVCARELLGEPD